MRRRRAHRSPAIARSAMLDGASVSVLLRPQRLGEVEVAAIHDVPAGQPASGALMVVQTILPGMKPRSWGRVVNISREASSGLLMRPPKRHWSASCVAGPSNSRRRALPSMRFAPDPTETELFRANNPPAAKANAAISPACQCSGSGHRMKLPRRSPSSSRMRQHSLRARRFMSTAVPPSARLHSHEVQPPVFVS